jgi:DegV family protein with EDD domain
MTRVALVTDSTAYLPQGEAAARGIAVVPVHVVVAGRSFDDGGDITAADVADALREFRPVTTSRPSPQSFLDAYSAAKRAGAEAVVSAHLSADISGTYGSAVLAASESGLPVEVVDSRSIGMGLGFAVLAGARCAQTGGDLLDVAAAVRASAARTRVYVYVDTLEYLRRGGRIRAGSAAIGSALSIKPILQVDDGRVVSLEKVRTASRAIARLEEIAVESAASLSDAGGGPVRVAVQHIGAADRAATLASHLGERLGVAIAASELGAVVGAHVGPGTVAVVVAPAVA